MKAQFILLFLVGFLTIWAAATGETGYLRGSLGRCPRPQGPGVCAELCGPHRPCGPGEKCCSNGCGHQCMRVTGGTR